MNPIEDWPAKADGLGNRLRAVREQAGLSGKELAKRARWQPSKVSRIETGQQMPASDDIGTWVHACGASDAGVTELLQMLAEAQTARRAWKQRMRRGQRDVQASYNDLAQGASLIRHFETAYMPGLVQTADYARCVLGEMVDLHSLDVADVEAAVATRMQRQQLVYDVGRRFEFLLAEPVLRWQFCPADAMRGQLDRLQTVLGLPNVRFGIVPMGRRIGTAPQNSFQMYDGVAIVETFVGETVYRDEEAVAYARAMDRLWESAVTGEGARHLILRAAEDVDIGA